MSVPADTYLPVSRPSAGDISRRLQLHPYASLQVQLPEVAVVMEVVQGGILAPEYIHLVLRRRGDKTRRDNGIITHSLQKEVTAQVPCSKQLDASTAEEGC